MLNNDYILVLVALFCLTSVHSRQVCEVSHSKLGEGYNIMTAEKCGEYCGLVPQCHHWTWYRHHCPAGHCTEEDFVRQNICYALTDCRLVEEQCSEEECQSGHKSVAEVRIGCSQESELYGFFLLGLDYLRIRIQTQGVVESHHDQTGALIGIIMNISLKTESYRWKVLIADK